MTNEKEELKEIEKIDMNFVNQQLKVINNIPSYALVLIIFPIIGLLSFNIYILIISIVLFILFLKISIFFTKENITFMNFFSMIGYIFKPKYIIIRKKEYCKGKFNGKKINN